MSKTKSKSTTKRPRSDRRRSTAAVVKTVLKNPELSQRDIAKEAWVWLATANSILRETEQNGTLAKDPRILAIADNDLEIVVLWQDEIKTRFQNKKILKKMRLLDIANIIEKSDKRRSMIVGNATDYNWGIKSILDDLLKWENMSTH